MPETKPRQPGPKFVQIACAVGPDGCMVRLALDADGDVWEYDGSTVDDRLTMRWHRLNWERVQT